MTSHTLFRLYLIIFFTGIFGIISGQNNKYQLYYDKPAQTWTEALPLGNGRIGAMVFGNPGVERIQLNESTIWAGQPNNNANPDALENIPKVRELVFQGKYLEAQDLATAKVMSKTNSGMPYQSFGDLYLSFPQHAGYKNYKRELSLDSAIATVSYQTSEATFKREYFTSFTDQTLIIRLTANKPGKISFNTLFTSPHQDIQISCENKTATLSGVSSWHEGLKGKVEFNGRVTAKLSGGKLVCKDGIINVDGANEAILYISIATNFKNYHDISGNAAEKAQNLLDNAIAQNYSSARKEHVRYFQNYMNRSKLFLGNDAYPKTPTDKRIQNFKTTNDNYLVATYYQFGRYLLICSSQPGGQPANLQGIWNDKILPSWDSKYTTNINLEMNYWPAEMTNLTELNEPLFQLIKEVSETGKDAARIMYGTNGWVLHHNTDIWRITGAVDKAPSGMWPMGGVWLCRHLWEHYLYTGDTTFLRKVYPIMKNAAIFLNETMVKEPKRNWLVVCPSNSPENTHAGSDNKATTAGGCTLDNLLTYDLWNSVTSAAKILNCEDQITQQISSKIPQLAPLQIGRWGQLQEWMDDWDNPEDTHRHVSHLYGLFPGNRLSPFRTPELVAAARKSLIHRGDPSTGWSMAWKVCLWSRLLDGDHAYKLLTDQLSLVTNEKKKGGTYPNLFDAHPPFQIDGNFGCTAGIAEMLMQSHDGFIYLLPALPKQWKSGEIKGLVARGGFIIDLKWENNIVKTVTIKSTLGGNCRIRSGVTLYGAGLKQAVGKNTNPLFSTPDKVDYRKNNSLDDETITLPSSSLFDIETKAGEVYTLSSEQLLSLKQRK